MVIATSDSNSTLVSLDHALKRVSSLEALQSRENEANLSFRPTELFLPADAVFSLDEDEDEAMSIYLPAQGSSIGVDECLGCLPQVQDARDELLMLQKPIRYSRTSSERILYVGQGEVAHAVPLQADILVSDHATTCHILAVRSCSETNGPMCSLTHLDGANYEDCIRDMFARHRHHHEAHEEIAITIDIVGGFEDEKGSSRDISNWLLHLLADIAEEEVHFSMFLRNCAITSLNNNGYSPIGRGLALDCRTGKVFLASCEQDCIPHSTLRATRLWSPAEQPKLALIHDTTSAFLTIQPFSYQVFSGLDTLLKLKDDVLLRYTSTSPHCEEDDFCHSLRSSLRMVRDVPCDESFPQGKPILCKRMGRNEWKTL